MLDLPKRQLLDHGGKDVALTSGEFDILKIFAENPNRPLSRDWLLETTSHREPRPVRPGHRPPHHPHTAQDRAHARQADRDSHRARRRLYVRAARRIG